MKYTMITGLSFAILNSIKAFYMDNWHSSIGWSVALLYGIGMYVAYYKIKGDKNE